MTIVFAFKEPKLNLTFMQDWNEDSYQVPNTHTTQQLLHAAITSLTNCNANRFGLSFKYFFIATPLNIQLHKYIAHILQLLPSMELIQFMSQSSLSHTLPFFLQPVGWRLIYNCSFCPVDRTTARLWDLKEKQNISWLICTQIYITRLFGIQYKVE